MDQGGRNALFKTMNGLFGSESVWQQIFRDALGQWAVASQADDATDGDANNNHSASAIRSMGKARS